jgi:deoxyribose-phosphate aldolase
MTEEVLTSTILTERLGIIAEKIGISKDEILKKLPHYFDTKPFNLESVDETKLPDYIDHTILKPNATSKDIERLVKEAVENNFYAICVNGCRAALAKELIEKEKAKVKLAVVIGFPLGAMTTKAKIFESQEMVDMQVDELDMVMNVGKFLDGDYKFVYEDIRGIVEICENTKTTVKVILEISQLTPVQILDASIISVLAGAAFIKTSTVLLEEVQQKTL